MIWTPDLLTHICRHLSLRDISNLCCASKIICGAINSRDETWLKAGQAACGIEYWPQLWPEVSRKVARSTGRYVAMAMAFPFLCEPIRLRAAPLQGLMAFHVNCTVNWMQLINSKVAISATIATDANAILGSFRSDVVMTSGAYLEDSEWETSHLAVDPPPPPTAEETALLGRMVALLPSTARRAHIMHAGLACVVCQEGCTKALFVSMRTMEVLHVVTCEATAHILVASSGIWILDPEFNLTYRGMSCSGGLIPFEPTHENACIAALKGQTERMLAFLRRRPLADCELVRDVYEAAINGPSTETLTALMEMLPTDDVLHFAIKANRIDMARALVQRGERIGHNDISLAMHGSLEMLRFLIDMVGSVDHLDLARFVEPRTSAAAIEMLISAGMRP